MGDEIRLTKGQSTIVDERDAEWLCKRPWYFHHKGYAVCHSSKKDDPEGKQRTVNMHRLVWEKHNGPIPKGKEIDHINGNPLDNRLENLRVGTHHENTANKHMKKRHASKYMGVTWHKPSRKWYAQIRIAYVQVHIGSFDSEEEAARAYDAKARDAFGDFANLNFKGVLR